MPLVTYCNGIKFFKRLDLQSIFCTQDIGAETVVYLKIMGLSRFFATGQNVDRQREDATAFAIAMPHLCVTQGSEFSMVIGA